MSCAVGARASRARGKTMRKPTKKVRPILPPGCAGATGVGGGGEGVRNPRAAPDYRSLREGATRTDH